MNIFTLIRNLCSMSDKRLDNILFEVFDSTMTMIYSLQSFYPWIKTIFRHCALLLTKIWYFLFSCIFPPFFYEKKSGIMRCILWERFHLFFLVRRYATFFDPISRRSFPLQALLFFFFGQSFRKKKIKNRLPELD